MIGGSSGWWIEGAGLVGIGAPSYRGFRYSVEIISHGVWLYYRFPLSFREVQEMMPQRGIVVSHETIRQWCVKFGQTYANGLRRRRPRPGDTWHLDEVFLTINGQRRVPVARCRPGRECPGHSGHPSAGHQGRDQVLSQAVRGPGVRATGSGHRQAGQLPGGATPGCSLG